MRIADFDGVQMHGALRNRHPLLRKGMGLLSISVLLILPVFLAGCGPDEPPPYTDETSGEQLEVKSATYGVYNLLRVLGNEVEIGGSVPDPLFEAERTTVLTIAGDRVDLYEFETANEMEGAVERVKKEESGGHFYKTDRVLGVYTGNDARVLKALEDAFGEEIVGR